MSGCADDVMGDIAEREVGSVVLCGKRIGDMKGLSISFLKYTGRRDIRIIELGNGAQIVHDLGCVWPWEARGVVCRPVLNILRRKLENEVSVCLWKAVPIKHKRMQELSTCHRKDHPAAEPPRPLPTTSLGSPYPAFLFRQIVRKLCGAGQSVYRDGHTKLIRGIHCEHEACQTCPYRRRKCRGERPARPLVALSERPGLWRQEMGAKTREEPKEDPVQ